MTELYVNHRKVSSGVAATQLFYFTLTYYVWQS